MTVINPPGFLHNLNTHTAQVDRLSRSAAIMPDGSGLTFRQGVRAIGDLQVTANDTPNMTVNVSAGLALVRGSQNAFQGLYSVPNDGTVNLAISAAHATLPRIDLVVVRVYDSFYSGVSDQATIEVVTGTAASSPSAPATPANSLVLAEVSVPAADTTISSGQITDRRTYFAAAGGIVLCTSSTHPSHLEGLAIYETDRDRVLISDGTNWQPIGRNQDTCHVQRAAAQSIPNNTLTNISFDTQVEDTANMWSSGANVTVPADGRYSITGRVSLDNTAAGIFHASIRVNGSESSSLFRIPSETPVAPIVASGNTEMDLTAGDILTLAVFHNTGASRNTFTSFYIPEFIVRRLD